MLGRTSRATPEDNEQKFQVKNYTVHQRFDSENFNNDIGKNFSDFVTSKATVGSSLWLTKWGFFFPLQLCCSWTQMQKTVLLKQPLCVPPASRRQNCSCPTGLNARSPVMAEMKNVSRRHVSACKYKILCPKFGSWSVVKVLSKLVFSIAYREYRINPMRGKACCSCNSNLDWKITILPTSSFEKLQLCRRIKPTPKTNKQIPSVPT